MLGYVLNSVADDNSLAAETNREVLAGLTGVQCLGELPFIETAHADKNFPLDVLETELDLRTIEQLCCDRAVHPYAERK